MPSPSKPHPRQRCLSSPLTGGRTGPRGGPARPPAGWGSNHGPGSASCTSRGWSSRPAAAKEAEPRSWSARHCAAQVTTSIILSMHSSKCDDNIHLHKSKYPVETSADAGSNPARERLFFFHRLSKSTSTPCLTLFPIYSYNSTQVQSSGLKV